VIERIKLTVLMARPPVFMLLASYGALGLAQAGRGNAPVALLEILVVTAGFLIFSVACNDLADEEIDRVNLPGDPRRPLVGGSANRAEMYTMGVAGAVLALAASAALGWISVVVVAVGLAVSAAYSLRPVRIAERGAPAALLLPACYVAVPYLLGINAAHAPITAADLKLLAGLYLGFIGRILLKDFRDVRGDTLFGKRTFLVRHGRRWTCAISAACWAVGTIVILAVVSPWSDIPGIVFDALVGICALFAVRFIAFLSTHADQRRDDRLISTIAILGRGMILLFLAQLSMRDLGPGIFFSLPLIGLLTALVLTQAYAMARQGPRTRATVPAYFEESAAPADPAVIS
jgi:4-hydroxybenzoate polyprenyltransferase